MAGGDVFAFGPFQLDPKARRLTKNDEPVALTSRQFDLLHLLIARAGHVLSKDALIAAAWPDVAVTDNSLEQAISSLRRTLTGPTGRQYIETEARRGYRFAADVRRIERRETDEALDALLAPHRAWIEGRAALETLERDQIVRARAVFEDVLAHQPDQASAHVGLANACALQFEMTRADPSPDAAALDRALVHAREACRLDAEYGEAWATLGFVLDRTGPHEDALAASRRAVSLEPDNWRHHLRLAYVSWGEERLREARRTLALVPGLALAHWLAATVHVARQATVEAERELNAGLAAQPAPGTGRFNAVGLHWLLGLIHLSRDSHAAARRAFELELESEDAGHLYARECSANTWYALGALELREGRRTEAQSAFAEAVKRVREHALARVGLAHLRMVPAMTARQTPDGDSPRSADVVGDGLRSADVVGDGLRSADVVIAGAAALVLAGTADGRERAAQLCERLVREAPQGSAGWLLPIEPTLHISAHPEAWAAALARLRNRAT